MRRNNFHVSILLIAGTFLVLGGYFFDRINENSPQQEKHNETIHCFGQHATPSCMRLYMTRLTETFGSPTAFSSLKKQYAQRPEVVSECHQLTHAIGNAVAKLHQGNIAEAFTSGDSFCWSGFYHGVVEEAIFLMGKEKFLSEANNLCSQIEGRDRYSFDYYNCVHGLGHGLMGITDNELFEALPLCDRLNGYWEKNSCYGGVYMENIMVDNRIHFSKYLKKENLMYPCTEVAPQYKEQCYLMQTSYALSETQYNFPYVFSLCRTVDEKFQDTCAQSVGRDASGNSVSNIKITRDRCMLGLDERQQKNCMIGAVKDFISYYHGGIQAEELCRSFPEKFLVECLQVRADYLRTL